MKKGKVSVKNYAWFQKCVKKNSAFLFLEWDLENFFGFLFWIELLTW
jgi:hypothetical protein